MINIKDNTNCCGCEACVHICPKQCVYLEEDVEGFKYPKVNETVCISCSMCLKVCPCITEYASNKPLKQFAAINNDSVIREKSSSGGVFSLIAENIISKGGVVFGVRFDDNWQAVFDYSETLEGIEKFRGSKYVQASVGEAYANVRHFLETGRFVLFVGTPCQVSALNHYLRHDYDRLLTIDFICHGVPSPKIWKQYLNELTNNNINEIRGIQFRSKTRGWKHFSFDMQIVREEKIRTVSMSHNHNPYMQLFLNNVILRPSCYNCPAKGGRSKSDITLADFWGIELINPFFDDDKGTSLVLANSNKGIKALVNLDLSLWETNYEDVIRFNSSLINSSSIHPKRASFFKRFEEEKVPFINLIEDTVRLTMKQRIASVVGMIKNQLFKTWRYIKND